MPEFAQRCFIRYGLRHEVDTGKLPRGITVVNGILRCGGRQVKPNLKQIHSQHLRPGDWTVLSLGSQSSTKALSFTQYEHLEYLMELVNTNGKLMTVSGNVYVVAPDIVVYYAKLFRTLLAGASLNSQKDLKEKSGKSRERWKDRKVGIIATFWNRPR